MHIILLLQNLVELIDANTILRVTTNIGPNTNHPMYLRLQRVLTIYKQQSTQFLLLKLS
jgi:hypothetical protein